MPQLLGQTAQEIAAQKMAQSQLQQALTQAMQAPLETITYQGPVALEVLLAAGGGVLRFAFPTGKRVDVNLDNGSLLGLAQHIFTAHTTEGVQDVDSGEEA